MAKSTKHTAKVPKLEDYKPSFVTGEGDDREIDIDAALKALHTLMLDKAKAQDAAEDIKAEKAEVVSERDELQAKVDDKNAPDAQVEIAKANKRAEDAEAKAKDATARADRTEVAFEKGLTPAQAKRLQGETREELEADADELLEAWGAPAAKDDDGDDDDEDTGRQQPRPVVNGGDPKIGSVTTEIDYEKWADEQAASRF